MTTWTTKLAAAGIITTFMGFALPAHAVLLIDAGPQSVEQEFLPGDYVAGTEFTTSSSLTIRALGFLDAQGDGLQESHTVALWDATTQALLVMAEITPTSSTLASAFLQAVWYMEDIDELVIGPGTYRIAGDVGGNDNDATTASDDRIGNGVTLSSGYVRTNFPDGGFAFPNLTFSSDAIRVTLSTDAVGDGGDDNNDSSDVSEPVTLGLFGLGLAGLAVTRRRRRGV